MSTEFRLNEAGLRALTLGPEVRAVLRAKAEEAQQVAESIAPRTTEDHRHYADSFFIAEQTETLAGKPHAAALVVNDSDHAAAVEWGNEHAPNGHRVLGRALDAVSGG